MIVAAVAPALPYLAILLAIATFVASQREFRRRAKIDYVAGLEKRIAELEAQNGTLQSRFDECEKGRRDLRDENYRLMQQVLQLEKGTP